MGLEDWLPEVSVKNFLRGGIPLFVLLSSLYIVAGRGANQDSEIQTRGDQTETEQAESRIQKGMGIEEIARAGLYLNGRECELGKLNEFGYEGEKIPPLDFRYKIETTKSIDSVTLTLNEEPLKLRRIKNPKGESGNASVSYSGGKKTHRFSFEVKYGDGVTSKMDGVLYPQAELERRKEDGRRK